MEDDLKPRCERCKSTFTYVLRNGDIVCRSCGHKTIYIKEENNNEEWICPMCNGSLIYSKDTKQLVCKCGFKKPSEGEGDEEYQQN